MKKLFYVCVALISMLVFSSCENTSENSSDFKVQHEKKSKNSQQVNAIYDEKFANSAGIYVTEKYLYSIDTANVRRYDKETHVSTQITDASSTVVGVTKDCIYYFERGTSSHELYKLQDDMETPEYLYDVQPYDELFIDGKFLYGISPNGSIIKHINSAKKYNNSFETIYHGTESHIIDTKFYKNNIYHICENKIISISPKDGTEKNIELPGNLKHFGTSLHNSDIYLSNNKIVYVDADATLYSVDLDTTASKKFDIKVNSYFVANEKIYVNNTEHQKYCIDIETNNINNFIIPRENVEGNQMFGYNHNISDIGTGVIFHTVNITQKIICDYSGNKISELRE